MAEIHYVSVVNFANGILARKDPFNHHGLNVSEMCLRIVACGKLKFPPQKLEMLRIGALLHDVGKIFLDDVLLNYPRRLTTAESARMRNHVPLGHELLYSLDYAPEILEIVKFHQEHYDGSGYPYGLIGENIPFCARIVCLADVWESITHDRAYRKAMPRSIALREMARCDSWFDPKLYEIFLRISKD